MRRMEAEIAVVTGGGGDACDPVSFVWRGRSYVVRDVLGRWRERVPWWRAVLDGADAGELEERVWRVAASPGRTPSVGIYELGHARSWRLLRVQD